MRYSNIYIPTQKEAPQDAEAASHKLLARAGYVKKSGAGSFTLLPIGNKVMEKLIGIFGKQLVAEGFQKVRYHMPPGSGCNDIHGDELFKLLGNDLISYKQLPKKFYGVSEAHLDNIRPRLGLLFPKTFQKLWGIALCRDREEAGGIKEKLHRLAGRISDSLNICLETVEGISMDCSGNTDIHFFVPYETGEHTAVVCPNCRELKLPDSYACVHIASSRADNGGMLEKEKVYTPDAGTIDELTRFFGCSPDKLVKTLLYAADSKIVAALVRGDRELSEPKLKALLGCTELRMADYDTVKKVTGAAVGFAGPVGLEAVIVADPEVLGMRNFIVGANSTGYHLANVNPIRDFEPEFTGDIRCAEKGDKCSVCGSDLEFINGFVIGSIKMYDRKYMDKSGLSYRNEQGGMEPMEGVGFSLNLDSLLAVTVEKNHDEAGILMPVNIAPFDAEIVVVNAKDEFLMAEAEKIYQKALNKGIDMLLDDRDERAGVKFKDCELIGIPVRITVGKRINEGMVEYRAGRKEVEELTADEALERLEALLVLTR